MRLSLESRRNRLILVLEIAWACPRNTTTYGAEIMIPDLRRASCRPVLLVGRIHLLVALDFRIPSRVMGTLRRINSLIARSTRFAVAAHFFSQSGSRQSLLIASARAHGPRSGLLRPTPMRRSLNPERPGRAPRKSCPDAATSGCPPCTVRPVIRSWL
jgi:hypothetical protein